MSVSHRSLLNHGISDSGRWREFLISGFRRVKQTLGDGREDVAEVADCETGDSQQHKPVVQAPEHASYTPEE